uniref:GPN-loop GTPase 2 n=1 Tax=Ciona intestinalis TaxID=7719 RepID=F6STU7_CIOIN|nr:GPN-loop GTPase 2 [Ciona intestinalis]|eukprot:XP_002126760.1 GPN-loop GTPase 2 [Ciona intestinalis]
MAGINMNKTSFGQLVIGPPGSGKTTFCHGMQQFMKAIGRECCVVNLDPANEFIPYDCDININELVTVEDVMKHMSLGPNGGLLYCMEYLRNNQHWLLEKMNNFPGRYFIFDCPGQVEIYTHHNALKEVIEHLTSKDVGVRLAAVHLVDAHYCAEASKFIAVLLTSLATMLHMGLPHVNVLSKMDIAEEYGKFPFHLEYYTEVLDLNKLLESDGDDPFMRKFQSLNQKLCSVIEDYSLVSFTPLNVQDKESMLNLLKEIDKANGCCFGTIEERNIQKLLSAAVGADFQFFKSGSAHEQYMS